MEGLLNSSWHLHTSRWLFSDPSTTRICAYILMLLRFCSCARASLQKFVYALSFSCSKNVYELSFICRSLFTKPISQRVRLFQLNRRRINCYCRSYLLHLYINLWKLTDLIKFVFNCLISRFCSNAALLRVSYTCSICSLLFRWRKCCEVQRRLCVENTELMTIFAQKPYENICTSNFPHLSVTRISAFSGGLFFAQVNNRQNWLYTSSTKDWLSFWRLIVGIG